MEDLEFVLTKPMYREQVKNAVLEYIGMMTEGEAKMKITTKQLRRIIKEEMHAVALSKGRDLDYGTGEGKMTRSQLHHVAEYAVELHDMIRDDDDLPEWVQSKVAVMASNIGKIKHYLEYKLLRMGEDA